MKRSQVTGWKLDAAKRERLLKQTKPKFPDVVADHVTLRVGTSGDRSLPHQTCGEVIGEIDDSDGVQALIVKIDGTTMRADGSTYHITWSLDQSRGRRAVESNHVIARLGWRPLPQPLPIRLSPARF